MTFSPIMVVNRPIRGHIRTREGIFSKDISLSWRGYQIKQDERKSISVAVGIGTGLNIIRENEVETIE